MKMDIVARIQSGSVPMMNRSSESLILQEEDDPFDKSQVDNTDSKNLEP